MASYRQTIHQIPLNFDHFGVKISLNSHQIQSILFVRPRFADISG